MELAIANFLSPPPPLFLVQHVADHKVKYKWLTGGVEFIDMIPRTPSGGQFILFRISGEPGLIGLIR